MPSRYKDIEAMFQKLSRFTQVGAASTAVYIFALIISDFALGVDEKSATIIAYSAALPLNFITHQRYTYKANHSISSGIPQMLKFLTVHILIMFVSATVTYAVVELLYLPAVIGYAAAIAAIFVFSFILLDRWVFRGEN